MGRQVKDIAIFRLYPAAVKIDSKGKAYDASGKVIKIDSRKVSVAEADVSAKLAFDSEFGAYKKKAFKLMDEEAVVAGFENISEAREFAGFKNDYTEAAIPLAEWSAKVKKELEIVKDELRTPSEMGGKRSADEFIADVKSMLRKPPAKGGVAR